MMTKGEWSGGYVDGNGNNTYPYKVESQDYKSLHKIREKSVIDGEKKYLEG